MMGIMLPVFTVHTWAGAYSLLTADPLECRKNYQGEVFYVIILMFAASFLLVLILLLICVCIPSWIKKYRNNTRARDLVNHLGLNIENRPEGLLENENPDFLEEEERRR